MSRIIAENVAQEVLVVAHGGTLGTALRAILGSHALTVHTDLTGVHHLLWEDGRWNLRYLNRREHLLGSTD